MNLISNPQPGDSLDASISMYPSRLDVVDGPWEVTEPTTTTYGFVIDGQIDVELNGFTFQAAAGAYFCIPGSFLANCSGRVAMIRRLGYRGLAVVGKLEVFGRLAYIDGCSSTILVPPPRVGDPVLNYLHVPSGVDQAEHTHPTIRLGIVARGCGTARGGGSVRWQEPLTQGSVFLLHAQERHSFSTMDSPDGMDIVTYHPDSECGPSDREHPMLSRTFLQLGK